MPSAFVGFPATVFTGLYETLIPGNPEVLVVLQRPVAPIATQGPIEHIALSDVISAVLWSNVLV
jgi:hypothetical protein